MTETTEPIGVMEEGDPVGSLVTSQSPATRSGASSSWEFASVLQVSLSFCSVLDIGQQIGLSARFVERAWAFFRPI